MMDRKEFLKNGLALCGLTMIPAALIESCTKSTSTAPTNVNFTLDLTSSANASLNNVGGSVSSGSVIVICTAASTYVALSTVCTHQQCTVAYTTGSGKLVCPCHGGTYSASTGAVISGPPPLPLTKYNVTKSGNILTIKS